MSNQTISDLEALSDGVSSPFWDLFSKYVTQEWGPSGLRYQQAVRAAAQDANAVIELQKVLHTQEQILLLMRWPAERLQQLRQQARADLNVVTSMSRRGRGN